MQPRKLQVSIKETSVGLISTLCTQKTHASNTNTSYSCHNYALNFRPICSKVLFSIRIKLIY